MGSKLYRYVFKMEYIFLSVHSAEIIESTPFLAVKFLPGIFYDLKLQINISSLTEMLLYISWQNVNANI